MEAHAHKGLSHYAADRTPAQMFALVSGAILTVLGIVGFFVNADFSTGSSITAGTLIVFDVNGWLNLIYLVTGLLGLYAATRADVARTHAMGMTVVYLVLAVWGVFTDTIVGAVPANVPDTVLAAAVGAVALLVVLNRDKSTA